MILITVTVLNLCAALRHIDYNHLFVFAVLLKDQQHPHLKKTKKGALIVFPSCLLWYINMFFVH